MESTERDSVRVARPRWARVLDGSAIVAFLGILAVLSAEIFSEVPAPALVLSFLVGYVLADGISGVAHWFGDTFFDESTPVIGRLVIAPFREHHDDPLAITRHGFSELTGNSALALLPVVTALWWIKGSSPSGFPGGFAAAVAIFTAAALFVTNQIHRWAHQPVGPAPVRWLQRRGWILSPEHHAKHHEAPFDRCFCITAGWLNGLFDGLRLFSRCERAARALTTRAGAHVGSSRRRKAM